jgi:hypothetical protein
VTLVTAIGPEEFLAVLGIARRRCGRFRRSLLRMNAYNRLRQDDCRHYDRH